MNPFRPGVVQIIESVPCPVVPLALRGLWGSFFSRSYEGRAMRRLRGVFSRIALVVGEPVLPADVTLAELESRVLHLRGERR